jgi:hypothetical protein
VSGRVVTTTRRREMRSEPARAGQGKKSGSLSFISNNFSLTNKARLDLGLCFNLTIFTHLASVVGFFLGRADRLLAFIAPFLLPIGSLFAHYLLPICSLCSHLKVTQAGPHLADINPTAPHHTHTHSLTHSTPFCP